jgi:AcrR family transcriptional regulator
MVGGRDNMSMNRKEEIVLVTLELAAEKGLANVSMSMIADIVGIKKPSLYKHFASKEEIVDAMYEYLRRQAKEKANIKPIDYSTFFEGKTVYEILQSVVRGYIQMNHQEKMLNFYKVIYSERSLNPMAAKIVAEETDKMIIATKQLFYAMEVHKLLHFTNPDMSAVSFAMTIHGLMDYELDQSNGKCSYETDKNLLDDYLKWFCEENAV